MNGTWVTLHIRFADGEKEEIFGFWSGVEHGHYKITKLATLEQSADFTECIIHEGVWLFNPTFVWLVEQEQEIPVPGPIKS